MSSSQATTTYMLTALFHFERRGNRVRVTCSILPGWAVYVGTVHEFVSCYRAAMEAFSETLNSIERER